MPKVKRRAIHSRMFAVSVLTTFSAPPQILACIDSFLLPNSRNEEMMVMVSFGATAAGLFEQQWSVEHTL